MKREPFFWIITAWWVIFLICLVTFFCGTPAA
jgi:hypothetical protein